MMAESTVCHQPFAICPDRELLYRYGFPWHNP